MYVSCSLICLCLLVVARQAILRFALSFQIMIQTTATKQQDFNLSSGFYYCPAYCSKWWNLIFTVCFFKMQQCSLASIEVILFFFDVVSPCVYAWVGPMSRCPTWACFCLMMLWCWRGKMCSIHLSCHLTEAHTHSWPLWLLPAWLSERLCTPSVSFYLINDTTVALRVKTQQHFRKHNDI